MSKNPLFIRFIKFGIVGGSGVGVNQGILILTQIYLNIDYRIGSLIAIETAIISNFLLNYHWTWNDRKRSENKDISSAFIKFNISSFITAFLLNWLTLVFLTEVVHIKYWISNLAGISLAAIVNFGISNFLIFKK